MVKRVKADLSFEEKLEKLEGIVESLENGELALEKAVDRYQKGVRLHAELQADLDRMEKRVRMLTETGEEADFEEPHGEDDER